MNESEPLLSVIIGAYNCANTLPVSLDSIIEQTFTDFVCYICDDGSTDNTADVIKMYTKKSQRPTGQALQSFGGSILSLWRLRCSLGSQ